LLFEQARPGDHEFESARRAFVIQVSVASRSCLLVASVLVISLTIPETGLAGSDPNGDSVAQATNGASRMEAGSCGPDLQPFNVTVMGSHGTVDGALDVAISDGYAYVADGLSGLQIFDISEPSSPALVASLDTPGYAEGVFVHGDYAYVADGPGGLQVIDISAPVAPAYTGGCATQGFAYGVAVKGNYAYIGGGAGGLQVIDVSDPRLPRWIGSYDVCSTTWGVAVKGNYAYVAGGPGGLQIVDLANPVSPALVGVYDTRDAALGVAVYGEFAYVACGSSGLRMVSVADPASLMLVAKCPSLDFAYGLAVLNNYVYIAGGANGLQVMQVRASISIGDPDDGPPTGLVDLSGGSAAPGTERPYANALYQNSPNPFSSTTRISFMLKVEGPVSLDVFDAKGRLVRELVKERRAPNRYVEDWDGRDGDGRKLPAGMYFYRLRLPGWTDVKKMAFTR
jgi:hypothetical protein